MKKYLTAIGMLLFLAIGLTLAGFVDLNLTQGLYDPQNPFAIFMEAFGYLPLYLPTAIMLLAFSLIAKKPLQAYGSAALYVIIMLVLVFVSNNYLVKRDAFYMRGVIAVGVMGLSILLVCFRHRKDILQKLFFMGEFGFVYMLANNIIINVLKAIWQRPRFDDMLTKGTLSSFAPWYSIMGEGGSSFPSGHTGAACGIFVIMLLCSLFLHLSNKKGIMLVGCFAYVAAMAIGRMIMGRHFLSDTVAAAFIGYGLFLIMTHTPIYQKTLANTLTAASEYALDKKR